MRRLVALVVGTALTAVLVAPVAAAPDPPAPDDRLQWQLGDLPADLDVDAEVYDLDRFGTTRAEVRALHDEGRIARLIDAWRK